MVRHGEEIIYDNIETDNGETISLTVAQYIDYDLSQDGLQFHDPLYNQSLAEAVAHSGDPLFRAQLYFTNHPDLEVSKLATSLAVDRYQLGGRFKLYEDEEDKDEREKEKLHRNQIDRLRQRVVHLVMDLRMGILEQQLKAIQQAMRQATGDMERVMSLMQEYKIGGIPVIDDEDRLVGIVTNRDLRFEQELRRPIVEVMELDSVSLAQILWLPKASHHFGNSVSGT